VSATPESGWQPGAPAAKDIAPSIGFGALAPIAIYFLVRPHVSHDSTALIYAAMAPAGWVLFQLARTRRVDPIGMITLLGFVFGVGGSELLGGNALVLKVKESVFTCLFGITCLASLGMRRPMMFYLARELSAGGNDRRRAAYDELLEMPAARRVFSTITAGWGLGLITEALLRLLLAVSLPTGVFLAVAPVMAFTLYGGLFVLTVLYVRRARRLGEAELAEQGLSYPTVFEAVG
jgi:intracellular septation protein A